jgi:hypothetical protein
MLFYTFFNHLESLPVVLQPGGMSAARRDWLVGSTSLGTVNRVLRVRSHSFYSANPHAYTVCTETRTFVIERQRGRHNHFTFPDCPIPK